MKGTTRAVVVTVVASASAMIAVAPASAQRLATAPGFPSTNASCVGSALAFAAHYGIEGDSYPVVVHGAVGPGISSDATGDAPGSVGAFNSSLAQDHGSIMACVP